MRLKIVVAVESFLEKNKKMKIMRNSESKVKYVDRVIKGVAQILSRLYKGRIYKGICFFKRCIYSSIIEHQVIGAENLNYKSHLYNVIISGGKAIKIGKNFTCREGLRLEAVEKYNNQIFCPQIIIHDEVDVGTDCHIGSICKVEIGENVLMGSKVYITDHNHGYIERYEKDIPPFARELYSKGEVNIGKNVWIGDGVVIMPGVSIGEGAIIGANAVVTKDVPPFCVVAGVPAKILKTL